MSGGTESTKKPVIHKMTMHFYTPGWKPKKTYPVGATRLRGKTTYIKQFVMYYENGSPVGYASRRGKSLTEWVVKDGPRDRESPNFDHKKRY